MQTITDVAAILTRVMAAKGLTPTGWGKRLAPARPTAVLDIMSGRQRTVTLQRLDELAIAAGYADFVDMATQEARSAATGKEQIAPDGLPTVQSLLQLLKACQPVLLESAARTPLADFGNDATDRLLHDRIDDVLALFDNPPQPTATRAEGARQGRPENDRRN